MDHIISFPSVNWRPLTQQGSMHAGERKYNGRGVKNVRTLYRAGKENKNADTLSRSPVLATQVGIAQQEVQVSPVSAVPPNESEHPVPRD
jgi:hypothetical protein